MDDPGTSTNPQPSLQPDYGDSFADVYDQWYAHVTDADATAERVSVLASAAGNRRILELGVGSGRLAIPMLQRGLEVVGIDSSPAMLDKLATKDPAGQIQVHQGDMAAADELVEAGFGVVLIAFNTLFNLVDPQAQQRCLGGCAALLDDAGSLLIEAVVPADPPGEIERGLSTSRVELDRVVLAATEHYPALQQITGQHVDITEAGVRLRPWRIRYLFPEQIDEMAALAGLELVERHADWVGTPFSGDSAQHVSRYRRAR